MFYTRKNVFITGCSLGGIMEYTTEVEEEMALQRPDWRTLEVIVDENNYEIDICFENKHEEFILEIEAHRIVAWAIRQRIIAKFNNSARSMGFEAQKANEAYDISRAANRVCTDAKVYSQPKPKKPSKDLMEYKETLRDKLGNTGLTEEEANAIIA